MQDSPDLELMANRFNRLIKEVLQDNISRTCFQSWEVTLFIDLHDCRLTRSRRDEALRRYQRVVTRQVERGELPPIRFAEFVGHRTRKLALLKLPSVAGENPSTLDL